MESPQRYENALDSAYAACTAHPCTSQREADAFAAKQVAKLDHLHVVDLKLFESLRAGYQLALSDPDMFVRLPREEQDIRLFGPVIDYRKRASDFRSRLLAELAELCLSDGEARGDESEVGEESGTKSADEQLLGEQLRVRKETPAKRRSEEEESPSPPPSKRRRIIPKPVEISSDTDEEEDVIPAREPPVKASPRTPQRTKKRPGPKQTRSIRASEGRPPAAQAAQQIGPSGSASRSTVSAVPQSRSRPTVSGAFAKTRTHRQPRRPDTPSTGRDDSPTPASLLLKKRLSKR